MLRRSPKKPSPSKHSKRSTWKALAKKRAHRTGEAAEVVVDAVHHSKPRSGLKALLASAPLEGIDLTRHPQRPSPFRAPPPLPSDTAGIVEQVIFKRSPGEASWSLPEKPYEKPSESHAALRSKRARRLGDRMASLMQVLEYWERRHDTLALAELKQAFLELSAERTCRSPGPRSRAELPVFPGRGLQSGVDPVKLEPAPTKLSPAEVWKALPKKTQRSRMVALARFLSDWSRRYGPMTQQELNEALDTLFPEKSSGKKPSPPKASLAAPGRGRGGRRPRRAGAKKSRRE